MRYLFSIVGWLVFGPLALMQGQSLQWQDHSVVASGLTQLQVELYRGLVQMEGYEGDSILIQYGTYDYDVYDESERLVPFYRPVDRTQIEFSKNGDTYVIKEESSREIIALKITLPKSLSVKLEINHLALVEIAGIEGELEVSAFSGILALSELTNSVSAHLVRDGHIDVSFASLPRTLYGAFSVYDGDIDLQIPQDASIVFEANTDLGEVKDEFNLDWQLTNPRKFEVKEQDGERKERTGYRHEARMGTGASKFLIKNIQGNINIKKAK